MFYEIKPTQQRDGICHFSVFREGMQLTDDLPERTSIEFCLREFRDFDVIDSYFCDSKTGIMIGDSFFRTLTGRGAKELYQDWLKQNPEVSHECTVD